MTQTSVTPLIGSKELAQLVAGGDVVLLDATVHFPPARFDGDYRPESGYAGWVDAHIPGSRHVDLMTTFCDREASLHFTKPSAEQLSLDLAAAGIGAGSTIVLYDQGSMTWASRLWWVLRNAGIDARVLDGGLAAWTWHAFAVESGDRPAVAHSVMPRDVADLDLWADRDDVAAISTGDSAGTLVCALSPEQFAGTEKTRYARRGHIPGSRNLSAKSLLDDDGMMLTATEVSLRAQELSTSAAPIVIYCGGGVSACLSALGLVMSGYNAIKVYDGSLEEWAADRTLPMVTGTGPVEGDRCRES